VKAFLEGAPSVAKVQDLAIESYQNFMMVELPYQIGDTRIKDILHGGKDPLESSLPSVLGKFIQLTLGNPERNGNPVVRLTDLFSHLEEDEALTIAKKKALTSRALVYSSDGGSNKYGDVYEAKTFHYSPAGGTELPWYRLYLIKSKQPQGGFYNMGFQLGTIDALQQSNYVAPINRDLDAEAHLAQELIDLFEVVESFGQPLIKA
jgi:hypothetical protein